MNITLERDKEIIVDFTNVYKVKVNGKVQGRITFHKSMTGKSCHGILNSFDTFDTQEEAAREVIRRNGRTVPSDVKIKKRG